MPPDSLATVQKTTLPNGVRILSQRIPHACSVAMGIWVNAGARDESLAESGLCHFIEHMIFKGTQRRTAFEIARAFDAIGGHLNAFTGMEITCLHARVLDRHIATMIDILSDIFLNSTFDICEIERERPVIFQEIGMLDDSPDEYAHLLLDRVFWKSHPLGRSVLGTRENIARFDTDQLKTFVRRFYQPERIIIAVAGNLEHQALVDQIGPDFAAITSDHPFPARQACQGTAGRLAQPRQLEQIHLCIGTAGISLADPRRYAATLMNTLLGGNMSSRLFQEIREKRGLAYNIYSFLAAHEDSGMLGAYAGTDPKWGEEVLDLLLAELRRLKREPVTPKELDHAKEHTKGCLLLATEGVESQMVRIAQSEFQYQRYRPMEEILAAVDAVTPADILSLANDILTTETLALSVLGPEEELDRFGAQLYL